MLLAALLTAAVLAAAGDPNIDLIGLLSNASGPALMAIIIVGAIREWWVPASVFKRTVAERDELLKIVMRQAQAQERIANVAEKRTDVVA